LHEWFFWLSFFFLVGVLIASILPSVVGVVLASLLLASILYFLNQKFLALISLFAIIGSVYYLVFDFYQNRLPLVSKGIIVRAKQRLNYQELVLDNDVKIITARYPKYQYGDKIVADGEIKKSQSPLLRGVMNYPKIQLVGQNQGNKIKAWLVNLRIAFENNLKKVLPHDKAVFLSGLTVGDIAEISKEFDEALKASGTTHLVALSGYNIGIITNQLGWLLGFWPTLALVIAFVVMTGAEASLVRAAIMGTILLVAQRIQRKHSQRNAIIFAALIMVLFNPKILVFDLGFQLSFLALLGIIYFQPKLEKISGYWVLKKYAWPTIAAQIAVLPLIILKFGRFNPLSVLANFLILPLVPSTMYLGFIVGFLGFIAQSVSLLLAQLVNFLLTYEISVINFFAFNF